MPPRTVQVAVVGAGYVGRRVLDRLEPGSFVALGRSAVEGHAVLDLDLDREPVSLPVSPGRILYTVPPSAQSEGDPRLERLLGALAPAPERIVYLSTSGVYGDCSGDLVDETRPPAPATPRALRRHAAEKLLQSWCSKNGTRCIIFRVPGIYGPGRLGVERIAAGEPGLRESDANPGNRIHVDDLSAAIIAALERSIPDGIYNIADGDFRSSTWFARCVAELAGLEPPQQISRDDAARTLSPGRLSFLGESRRLDARKMREVLGFEPIYADAAEGIRASLLEDSRKS